MKKAVLLFLTLILACCSKETAGTHDPGEIVEVTLGIKIDVRYESLTRADDGEAVYWLQVYTKEPQEAESKYRPYAYGLFDKISGLNMEVYSDMDYRVQAALFRNFSGSIKYPYTLKSQSAGNIDHYDVISNSFTYSDTDYLSDKRKNSGLSSATYYDKSGNMIYYPEVEYVFYGQTDGYNYQQMEDMLVSLGRANAGIRLVVNNLSEGTVKLISKPGSTIVKNFEIMSSDPEHFRKAVLTVDNLQEASGARTSENRGYFYYFDVELEKDGQTEFLGTRDCLVMTGKWVVIEINLSEPHRGADEDASIGLYLEGEELGEGEKVIIEQ